MTAESTGNEKPHREPALSIRFWERGRLLYNAILLVIVLLWVVLSWPHFRPSLTLGSLIAMGVLAVLANACYSSAYLAELGMRLALPSASLRRFRWVVFVLGTAFAILLANYWIADEIYPYASQPPKFF
jgi:hypothetical protein